MTYPSVPAAAQRSYASQIAPSYAATGLTGATAGARFAGATASGPPVSGTFAKGDYVTDQSGTVWVCTAAGSPGTWTAQLQDNWGPADQGYIAWAYDAPASTSGSAVALTTGGTLYTVAMKVGHAVQVTNIVTYISAIGGTLTSGQCFAALFQGAGGALLGVTADQTSTWEGTPGLKVAAIGGGPVSVAAGTVIVGFWFNGTTGPSFWRTSSTATMMNAGLATASNRWGAANAGLTTTAPPTLGTITLSAPAAYWAALS